MRVSSVSLPKVAEDRSKVRQGGECSRFHKARHTAVLGDGADPGDQGRQTTRLPLRLTRAAARQTQNSGPSSMPFSLFPRPHGDLQGRKTLNVGEEPLGQLRRPRSRCGREEPIPLSLGW